MLRVQRLELLRVGLFGNHPFILYSTPSAPLFLIPGSSCTSYLLSGSCISVELLSHIGIYAASTRVAQGRYRTHDTLCSGGVINKSWEILRTATHTNRGVHWQPPFQPPPVQNPH